MNKPISTLTYKIVAFAEIQDVDTNESIDWAIEMIELGHESPALFMLAAFIKPTNYFEVIEYVKDTIQELELEMKSGDDATLSYTSFYVQLIANKVNIRENLTELYKFCQSRDYECLVYDFYLLYWAWDDIDFEDNDYNHYWAEAKTNNIEQIVVGEAKKWIKKNKYHYAQQHV